MDISLYYVVIQDSTKYILFSSLFFESVTCFLCKPFFLSFNMCLTNEHLIDVFLCYIERLHIFVTYYNFTYFVIFCSDE